MLTYMTPDDPTRDIDELNQDEVIRETLEQLGTTAARHVWKDVCTDVSAVKYYLTTFLEWLFPLIVVYQQQPSRFYEDIQNFGIAFALFVWGFFILAPKHMGSRGKTVWNQSCNWLAGTMGTREDSYSLSSPSPGHSAAGSGSQVDEFGLAYHDDETDEERYEKFYAALEENSPLRRLILPPSCRLVEKPSKTDSEKQRKAQTDKEKSDLSEEENPAQRLSNYYRQFMHFLRAIVWFDYVGAGWTLIYWLHGIHRYRTSAIRKVKDGKSTSTAVTHDETDEEPDNQSVCHKMDDETSSEFDDLQSPRCPQYHPAIVRESSHSELKMSSGVAHASALLTQRDGSQLMAEGKLSGRILAEDDDSYCSPHVASCRPRSGSESSENLDHSHSTLSTNDTSAGFVMKLVRKRRSSNPALPLKKDALDAWRKPARRKSSRMEERSTSQVSTIADQAEYDDTTNDEVARIPITSTQPQHELAAAPAASSDEEGSGRFYFDTEHSDVALRKLSIDIPVPDRNGYILGDHFLSDPKNSTPMLVFVNSRSGPQQGQLIISQLRRLLNPIQIWDLANGGPEAVLESFLALTRLRILVCGGDGTVSWIISSLEQMKLQRKWPPIAILPLGTGNDLARMHGWGGGYNNESLLTILEQISESYISLLDRWEVTIDNKQSKKMETKCFMNYLGVGADAQAALQVHYLRESRPDWFFSRLVNKIWYGVFGAEDIIMASSVNVRKEIKLVADGVHIPLPQDSQGIILLNIDSYAGGVPMWSHGVKDQRHDEWRSRSPRRSKSLNSIGFNKRQANYLDRTDSADDLQMLTMSDEERYEHVTACDRPSSCQDGVLEIVSIRGAFHLGQIRVGLGNAQRLCQCREAVITIKNKVAVQVDGEPWKQRPCTIRVRRKPEHAVMLHRSMDDGGIESEMSKLLEWAELNQLIDRDVHAVLMKEFSRRIENITRQRRVREQDNIMITLKKAISQNALASNMNASSHWHGGIAF